MRGMRGRGKRVWPESSFPPPLPTPPPLPLLCPASGHSYPAAGPAAVPPPQGSEQPLHGAAGLHDVRRAGVPTAGLNNAGARPGASWKRPGGGSCFPWVEGRLSGWCEEKPSPGSGGSAGGKGAGRCSRKWGGEDVGEARRSDSQDLPCWEGQPRIFCPPAPWLWSCPMPKDPAYAGICKDPEIQPSVGRGEGGGGRIKVSGQGSRASGEHCVPGLASLPA